MRLLACLSIENLTSQVSNVLFDNLIIRQGPPQVVQFSNANDDRRLIWFAIVKEEDPKEVPNERSANRFATPRIWSFLWRGAVGGILGALLLVGVAIYRNPMNVLG